MSAARPRRKRLTRNRMGWASCELNEVSEMFVRFSPHAPGPVLDLGAGYGVASLAALQAGARVIANDLDPRHLEELQAQAHEWKDRLLLRPGRFPQDLHFAPHSLGAVLAANVFHFLNGKLIERGLRAIARWLAPGGKLFVVASTPYQSAFESFIPEYERRGQAGVPWPGWIVKVTEYCFHRQVSQMPRSIHLLDDQVLARAVTAAGLKVECAWFFRRRDLPEQLHWDGRETVGLIASQEGVPATLD